MYIDPNNMQGIYVSDPNKVINTIPRNTNMTADGIFSRLQAQMPYDPVPTTTLSEIVGRVERLEFENKCLRLKIACMEGKFSQEEVTNIRKMLMSQDESSVTLAETIIDNA
jgi:hypothetical protein